MRLLAGRPSAPRRGCARTPRARGDGRGRAPRRPPRCSPRPSRPGPRRGGGELCRGRPTAARRTSSRRRSGAACAPACSRAGRQSEAEALAREAVACSGRPTCSRPRRCDARPRRRAPTCKAGKRSRRPGPPSRSTSARATPRRPRGRSRTTQTTGRDLMGVRPNIHRSTLEGTRPGRPRRVRRPPAGDHPGVVVQDGATEDGRGTETSRGPRRSRPAGRRRSTATKFKKGPAAGDGIEIRASPLEIRSVQSSTRVARHGAGPDAPGGRFGCSSPGWSRAGLASAEIDALVRAMRARAGPTRARFPPASPTSGSSSTTTSRSTRRERSARPAPGR